MGKRKRDEAGLSDDESREHDPQERKRKKKKKKKEKKDAKERAEEEEHELPSSSAATLHVDGLLKNTSLSNMEVDFIMLGNGMSREDAKKRGWTFSTCVKVSKELRDLTSCKRYLRQQHVKPRMDKNSIKDYDIELCVLKDGTKELFAESPTEWDVLLRNLLETPESYSLLVLAKAVNIASRAAAMIVLERRTRNRKRQKSEETKEDQEYEWALREHIEGRGSKPVRNVRQEQLFVEYSRRVAEKFGETEVINDVQLKCGRCLLVWKLNRRWYDDHFGTNHYGQDACRRKQKDGKRQVTMAEFLFRSTTKSSGDQTKLTSCDGGSDKDVCVTLDDVEDSIIFIDPVAEMLNKQVMEGSLNQSHVLYKYLHRALSFAEHAQNGSLEDFSWNDHGNDSTVLEFLSSILHSGHASTYNLLRGPGFLSQGRGRPEFNWEDWNFPLPPPEKLKKHDSGYTTESGVIAPFLHSFLNVCESSSVARIVDDDSVRLYPVAEADDGMALKPGMQVDRRTKTVVGTTEQINLEYVQEHIKDDPTSFTDKFVKEAHTTCATTLDCKVSLVLGVDYIPNKLSGQNMLDIRRQRTNQIQTCLSCLETLKSNALVPEPTGCELDTCSTCLEAKNVCNDCSSDKLTQWDPSLRPCKHCRNSKIKCIRLVSFCKVSDCEEKNKKALKMAREALKDETVAHEFRQQIPLPDAVHLGKNLNGSFSNWFLLYNNSRFNKSMLRTLYQDPEYEEALHQHITMKALRNRDRMDTTVVTEVSSPEVRQVLGDISLCSHTIIPETFRMYESNRPGVLTHPTHISCGPEGCILVTDFTTGILSKGRLHYPVDVVPLLCNLDGPLGVCYGGTTVYVAETRKNRIVSLDLAKKVKKDGSSDRKVVQLDSAITQPTALAISSQDHSTLYIASKEAIHRVEITDNGEEQHGRTTLKLKIEDVSGMCLDENKLYVAKTEGIYLVDTQTDQEPTLLIDCSEHPDMNPYDVTISNGKLFFTDIGQRKIYEYSLTNHTLNFVIGRGTAKISKDGSEKTASFAQPLGICSEQRTLFVCDTAVGSVKMITPVDSLVLYLESMYSLYDSFGVHTDSETSFETALDNLNKVLQFLRGGESDAKRRTTKKCVQGPEGVVPSKTVESIQLLHDGLRDICENVDDITQGYSKKVELKSLLTLVCEHMFSLMRSRYDMPLVLQFAQLLAPTVMESLKSMADCGYRYYRSRNSYYDTPKESSAFKDFPKIPQPASISCTRKEEYLLQRFQQEHGQSVRQMTVRDLSTKDKPGTLPISAYGLKKPTLNPLNVQTMRPENENENQAMSESAPAILLPRGTLVVTSAGGQPVIVELKEQLPEITETEDVRVKLYEQSPLDCLLFNYTKSRKIPKSTLKVILEASDVKMLKNSIEVSEDCYQNLVSESNQDYSVDSHDSTTDDAGISQSPLLRCTRQRKKPRKLQYYWC